MNKEQVVFWSLRQKFVDSDEDMPAKTQQVVYYSLAIGHHVGMIDCLKAELTCDLARFRKWIAHLPESEARRKMRGLLNFGEITIDATHTHLLANAFAHVRENAAMPYCEWSARLITLLQEIEREPAIYLIVRRQSP